MRLIGLAVVLTLSLVLTSLAAEGQQTGKVYRIGILTIQRAPLVEEAGLRKMRELGYVEGRNLVLEWRFSEGNNDRYSNSAAELVRLNVDLILTLGNPAAEAAKRATNTIPIVMATIVMATSGSPDRVDLVASLARPSGNVTGMAIDTGPEIAGKMLQLLKEVAPTISRVATLVSGEPAGWFEKSGAPVSEVDAAGKGLGLTLTPIVARGPDDFSGALAAIARGRADALFVTSSGPVYFNRRLIFEFAAKQRLPAVYAGRQYVEDGGLMSYGFNYNDVILRALVYVDISKHADRVNDESILVDEIAA